jgi:hypothetical protein
MEEQISIKVSIADRLYPLRIKAAEEEKVRKAVKLINDKEKNYRDQFAMKDKQDALAMTSLELATALETEGESSNQTTDSLEKLNRLDAYLDSIVL